MIELTIAVAKAARINAFMRGRSNDPSAPKNEVASLLQFGRTKKGRQSHLGQVHPTLRRNVRIAQKRNEAAKRAKRIEPEN
jgi:hypothetical protein